MGIALNSSFVALTGHVAPYMITSSIAASLGLGFMTTFTVTTSHPQWIGLQFLAGIGLGLGLNKAKIAIQVLLPKELAPISVTLVLYAQTLAAAIYVSVAQAIFLKKIMSGIAANIPNVDPRTVLSHGILNLKPAFDDEHQLALREVYNAALVDVFYLATALSAFSIFGALLTEWKSIKKGPAIEHDAEKRRPQKFGQLTSKLRLHEWIYEFYRLVHRTFDYIVMIVVDLFVRIFLASCGRPLRRKHRIPPVARPEIEDCIPTYNQTPISGPPSLSKAESSKEAGHDGPRMPDLSTAVEGISTEMTGGL